MPGEVPVEACRLISVHHQVKVVAVPAGHSMMMPSLATMALAVAVVAAAQLPPAERGATVWLYSVSAI